MRLAHRVPPGHEQEGIRPCIVVGEPTRTGPDRFGMVLVAPLTTFRSQSWQARNPALYPVLATGTAGISVDSIVLLDQTHAVDPSRASGFIGTLSPDDYLPLAQGLRMLCAL